MSLMTPERWEQVADLFHEAMARPPEQRDALLTLACKEDSELRIEVESLLAADAQAAEFIADPAFKEAARQLAGDPSLPEMGRNTLPDGAELGQYKILSIIGVGGMGEVYRAVDPRLHRQIALKILPAAFTNDQTRVRRFVREARAVSALNHPNILTIYEIGEAEGRRFIATEFVEGRTLRDVLAEGRMSLANAIDIAIQIAAALSVAHEAGIVHRDIKPENIMLRPDGLVKVLDFGLAKVSPGAGPVFESIGDAITDPGFVLGTASYMSPEQIQGDPIDARSDLFSFGVVLYEMLAGRRPFDADHTSHLILAILEESPAPLSTHAPEVPLEFETILVKLLQKDPSDRYPAAADLLSDLQALRRFALLPTDRLSIAKLPPEKQPRQQTTAVAVQLTNAGGTAQPTTGIKRAHRQIARLKTLLAISLTVALLASALALFLYLHAHGNAPPSSLIGY